jgi:diguanylate cyclase (GGDEF)-like protein
MSGAAALQILLVEDNPADARLTIEALSDSRLDCTVRVAPSTNDAVALLAGEDELPDVVLLDLNLPDADGISGLAELRARAPLTPIVMLTGLADEAMAQAALEHGAQDYLFKNDVDHESLDRAIRYAIQRSKAQAAVTRLATHDALTGLPNRVLLLDRIEHALARARRSGSRVAVLFVDLDGFKRINDEHGHDAGDAVLRAAATRMSAVVRPGDTVCRLGGDEFVMVCEDVGDEGTAAQIQRRVLAALRGPVRVDGASIELGASVGVAMARPMAEDAAELLHEADVAMYHKKRAARVRPRP